MISVNVSGVPEHFNIIWHLALENRFFEKYNIALNWIDCPEGTGKMTQLLNNHETDIAVVLTEGIILDIIKNNKSKIVQNFIKTPLIWGIHTGYNNAMKHYVDIFDKKYAISRIGSGSHLMSLVDAQFQKKTLQSHQFCITNNLSQSVESLKNIETDVFYWEKFTTNKFVLSGELRRIGEFVTPWPCFMIAANNQFIEDKGDILSTILKVINYTSAQFMNAYNAIEIVADKYDLNINDAQQWFYQTEWNTHEYLSNKMLQNVVNTIYNLNLIDKKVSSEMLCSNLTKITYN